MTATQPMNPQVKAQWLEKLRSGEYRQARGSLHLVQKDGTDRFCCLGVLCDLAAQEGVVQARRLDVTDEDYVTDEDGHYAALYAYGDGANQGVLPREVRDWAGLVDANPTVNVKGGRYGPLGVDADTLSGINDTGADFEKIAGLIEEQL